MKKIIYILFIILLSVLAYGSPNIKAKSYVLTDYESGRIIYSKNPDRPCPMASTTKIMTAVVFLEKGPDKIIYSSQAKRTPFSNMNFPEGTVLSKKDALSALMIPSSNDMAVAIGLSCGDMNDFIDSMNRKAKDLGMKNTHYVCPHGLDTKNHYSSASDIAILSKYAWSIKDFRNIIKPNCEINPVTPNGPMTKKIHSTFENFYNYGIKGIKTGTTHNAGKCFAGIKTIKGYIPVITVVLGSGDAIRETKKLLEYADINLEKITVIHKETEYSVSYGKTKIPSFAKNNIYITKDKKETITEEIINQCHTPIKKGAKTGCITVKLNGKPINTVPLYSKKTVLCSPGEFCVTLFIILTVMLILIFRKRI